MGSYFKPGTICVLFHNQHVQFLFSLSPFASEEYKAQVTFSRSKTKEATLELTYLPSTVSTALKEQCKAAAGKNTNKWSQQCFQPPYLCLSKSLCLGLVMSPGLTSVAEPSISHSISLVLHLGVLLISPHICVESLFSFVLLPPAGLTSCPEFWFFGWSSVTPSNSCLSTAALKCQSIYLLPSIPVLV